MAKRDRDTAPPEAGLVGPTTLADVHHLDVVARAVVDGVRAGSHRSPMRGQSVDFADHRPYVPGDDLRHLDWKVLGRSDRLVLKRFEAELDLGVHLVVDGSSSMAYQGSRGDGTKYRYASVLAACMALMTSRQQDRSGLTIFTDEALISVPPQRQGAVELVCRSLENHIPDAAQMAGTDPGKGLERLGGGGRGLVVVFSDVLVEPDAMVAAIDRLRRRGHDAVLVWLLDPDEIDLKVGSVSRFEDLEGDDVVVAEPRALRKAYAAQVDAHRHALHKACLGRDITLIPATTDEPHAAVLNRLLIALNRE